jgi:hypothetical protein
LDVLLQASKHLIESLARKFVDDDGVDGGQAETSRKRSEAALGSKFRARRAQRQIVALTRQQNLTTFAARCANDAQARKRCDNCF